MKRYLLGLGLAFAMFTGCAVDTSTPSTSDELVQPADEDTTASESQAVEVPEALVPGGPITNTACRAISGTGCLTPFLCQANGGTHISATGCTGKNICCKFGS